MVMCDELAELRADFEKLHTILVEMAEDFTEAINRLGQYDQAAVWERHLAKLRGLDTDAELQEKQEDLRRRACTCGHLPEAHMYGNGHCKTVGCSCRDYRWGGG